MLPCGTLREFRSGAKRADMVIVTKTPKIFSPITRRRILDDMKPTYSRTVVFSYIRYGELFPLFQTDDLSLPQKITSILLFTGIASDYPLIEYLERMCSDLVVLRFPDHHDYTPADLTKIISRYNDLPTQKKIMVTTEKDAMRLKVPECADYFKNLPLFCIPMEIDFHGEDKALFDEEIARYVRENIRNR
jgi:tetraacyldisaccharide 4'-kinase